MSAAVTEKEPKVFTSDQIAQVDPARVPEHIAFIPDGNRRWAKQKGFEIVKGHQRGADILMDIVKGCKDLGVKTATFFIFSTENWNRSPIEVQALMWILRQYLIKERPRMIENGIKLSAIGEITALPNRVQKALQETIDATAHCDEIEIIFALSYGGRDEIRRAVCRMVEEVEQNRLTKEEITEELVGQYLDTAQWKDPDLFIRTSGEMRLSNFLLWQASYAEVYITSQFWPDFTPDDLLEAVKDYEKRDRRRGG